MQRSATKVIVVAKNMCTTVIITKDAGRDPTYLQMEGSLAYLIKLILSTFDSVYKLSSSLIGAFVCTLRLILPFYKALLVGCLTN